jgi:hypothetical protein
MVTVFVFIVVFILVLTSVIWRWVRGAIFMPFLFGIQVLLNSIHDVPKSGDVETNMNFTIGRCGSMRLDYVRDI